MNAFKRADKSKSLVNRSNTIVDGFTKTITDLNTVNEEIKVEDGILSNRQAEIAIQRENLEVARSKNAKVSGKIQSFLED